MHLSPEQAISNQPQSDSQIRRTFWRYTLPSVVAMLVSGLYIIIDGIFVGQYVGPSGLAGINMAWPVVYVLSALGVLIGMGAGSMISMFRGEGDPAKARLALSSSFFLMLALGALGCFILVTLGHATLDWQDAVGATYEQGARYIDVFAIAGVITVAANALPMLIRNDDSPNLATGLLLVGAIGNIALDYLFVGVLSMGLAGAAIATVIAQGMITLLGLGYFFSRYSGLKLSLRQIHLDIRIAGRSVVLGCSCLVMFLYSSFVVAIHNYLFMQHGDSVTIGAFAIVGYLMSLYYLLAQGVAEGMQPQASFYHGAGQKAYIAKVVKIAASVIILSGLTWTALLNLFPDFFIGLFSQGEPAIAAQAATGFKLHLFAMALDGFIAMASVFFMSVNQPGKAMLTSMGNMLVQIPFLLWLPDIMGVNGVWLAMPISNLLLSSIVAVLVWRELRKPAAEVTPLMAAPSA